MLLHHHQYVKWVWGESSELIWYEVGVTQQQVLRRGLELGGW